MKKDGGWRRTRTSLHGVAHMKPDYRQGAAQGTEVNFFPPLPVTVDAPELRYAKLSRVVAEHVVPRLLALHEQAKAAERRPLPLPNCRAPSDIEELAKLVLGSNDEEAAGFILGLKDGGVSLDSLHMELLEPTARHLGELWNQDRIDFVDVTLGVARLQRLVHVFEGLDEIPDYDEKRKVLLATAPGEQHSLGSTIVQKFLRAAGLARVDLRHAAAGRGRRHRRQGMVRRRGLLAQFRPPPGQPGEDHQRGCGRPR